MNMLSSANTQQDAGSQHVTEPSITLSREPDNCMAKLQNYHSYSEFRHDNHWLTTDSNRRAPTANLMAGTRLSQHGQGRPSIRRRDHLDGGAV